uniref:Gustatory receptor n=1 Tax=Anopheles quadriannulatus TaxID=34691 RepID=A0A182XNX5_ANOQN
MYRRSVAVVMLLNESLNVYSSMEVLYWILRLFGYAPFRLQLDADTPDRDAFGTWQTKLYTISFGLAYTLAYIKFMSELKHTGFSASMIEGKGERMYFTFNFFTTMYGVVNGYAVRDKIEKMLYKLHAVDQKISQWKRNVDHRRFYRNVWAGVYLIAIVLLIYIYGTVITCQLHENSCNMQILFVFIYLLFVNSYALMMLQCIAFMEIIRTRYKLLNGCFRCLLVQNVHDTFRPFYYLLKVTGLAPFRLNSQPSNDRKELYYAFGYSASFICVYSYAIYGYLFTTNTGHLYISKIVAVMENGYMFSEFMVTNVAIIFGLVLRNRVLEIFVQLAEIDEQLNVLRLPIKHNRQHRLLTVLCSIVLGSFLFLLLVTISTVTSRLESFDTPALDVAALAISSFCFLLQIVQFTVMVLLVLSRYQTINELFR